MGHDCPCPNLCSFYRLLRLGIPISIKQLCTLSCDHTQSFINIKASAPTRMLILSFHPFNNPFIPEHAMVGPFCIFQNMMISQHQQTCFSLINTGGGKSTGPVNKKPALQDMTTLSEFQVTNAPDLKEETFVSAAPPPVPERRASISTSTASSTSSNGFFDSPAFASASLTWKILYRKVLRQLSSLPRAIALMGIVAALSGLGTVVPQNKVGAVVL